MDLEHYPVVFWSGSFELDLAVAQGGSCGITAPVTAYSSYD
jgi:hypothetical protein